MRSLTVLLLVFVTAVFATAFIRPPVWADDFTLFDSAMSQVGMTHEEIRFDQDEMANWGGDLWRTRYFTMFHRNPFKLPKHGEINLQLFSENVTNITALLAWAGARIDCPVRRGLIGDQLEQYLTHPDSLPKPSITKSKNVLMETEFAPLRNKIDLFYRVVDDSTHFFVKSIDQMNQRISREKLFEYFVKENQDYDQLIEEMAPMVDFNRLIAGAEDIAEAIKRVADSLEFIPLPKTKIEMNTPRGLIVWGSPGDDKYEYLIPPLLIIDDEGDDTYSFSNYPDKYPLTAIIDLAGNDRYLSDDSTRPGIGGAAMGMAVVIDKAGDDFYAGVNVAQGAGIFGVGILLDYQGNDTYVAKNYVQGSGVFGVGILADSSGNDSLHCYVLSQGFGYTKGCGLLLNYEGNDKYIAEDSIITNPSPQTDKHNASLSQGMGFGKRADFVDGHSWAGGVGILCDKKGNDYYSCGVFGQGCAYWFSVGMLLDSEGDDSYNGAWYVQGSGAHFAVGYLDDFSGNDTYNASMNMAIGAGHDFTIGYLNERSGNDTYNAPNLSLGSGNANGIGIFHDHSGGDVYNTHGGTILGRVNPLKTGAREFLNVFGVFIDGGGEDKYNEPWAKNSTRWIGPRVDTTSTSPYEIGVGIDK